MGLDPLDRVPMLGMNEYVNRPEWQSHVDMSEKQLKRAKTVDLLEKKNSVNFQTGKN